jgi:hypothetical protein
VARAGRTASPDHTTSFDDTEGAAGKMSVDDTESAAGTMRLFNPSTPSGTRVLHAVHVPFSYAVDECAPLSISQVMVSPLSTNKPTGSK